MKKENPWHLQKRFMFVNGSDTGYKDRTSYFFFMVTRKNNNSHINRTNCRLRTFLFTGFFKILSGFIKFVLLLQKKATWLIYQ